MPVQAGKKAIRERIRLPGIRTGAWRHCRQLASKVSGTQPVKDHSP
jgi:hypothetical protein